MEQVLEVLALFGGIVAIFFIPWYIAFGRHFK